MFLRGVPNWAQKPENETVFLAGLGRGLVKLMFEVCFDVRQSFPKLK